MIRKCYAKLNFTLDSLYKREDNYHEIDSIMVRISLYDILEVKKNNLKTIRIFNDDKVLAKIEDNLIYKAWDLLKEGIEDCGVDVKLVKNIPFAAGLAGGSSDCAEMIKALNEIWNLNLSLDQLKEYGKKLGADVSFFFMEQSCRAQGIGEILSPIKIKVPMNILLINDGTQISSAYIYKYLEDYGKIKTEEIIKGLENNDKSILSSFENVMEDVAFEKFPHLKKMKEKLYDLGANTALMSGSGASIFAIFDNEDKYNFAYESLKDKYNLVEKVVLVDD